jgi:hypothetical protein
MTKTSSNRRAARALRHEDDPTLFQVERHALSPHQYDFRDTYTLGAELTE